MRWLSKSVFIVIDKNCIVLTRLTLSLWHATNINEARIRYWYLCFSISKCKDFIKDINCEKKISSNLYFIFNIKIFTSLKQIVSMKLFGCPFFRLWSYLIRLLQKRTVCAICDIYFFITITGGDTSVIGLLIPRWYHALSSQCFITGKVIKQYMCITEMYRNVSKYCNKNVNIEFN